jgi:hypothetical protein
MLNRIEGIEGVESFMDALLKIDPNKVIDQKIKVLNQEKKVNQEKEKEKTTGSPRENVGIEGMDSAESSAPTIQPGTDLVNQPSPLPDLTKSWFKDNFGMEGSEICDLLEKSGRDELVQLIRPLIREERMALLKSYPSVSPALIDELPFTDFDYLMLQKNPNNLSIPFRRFVKSWNDSTTDEEKDEAYGIWSNRISKQHHLTRREDGVLKRCQELLTNNGALNAQSLQSYGLDVSTTEISMLIKSHGFLYGISAIGKGKAANVRSMFYDVSRTDMLIKDAGALIGGLFDNGGSIEIGSSGSPRLILPFNSAICKHYADALNHEMDTAGVLAEGDGLVIEGEDAVAKALDLGLPHIIEKKPNAIILRKSIDNHGDALRCLKYQLASPSKRVSLLKSWSLSDDDLESLKEVVING